MTRKHFEAIAKQISMTRGRVETLNLDQNEAIDLIVDALCDTFSELNPRFDTARFFKACERIKNNA